MRHNCSTDNLKRPDKLRNQLDDIIMRRQGGRHGGRGGRVSTNRREQNKHNQKKKKTLEDYWFYVGSNKQASDHDATQEFTLREHV